jgi:hypothetical protein
VSRLFDGTDDEMQFDAEGIALNGAWTMAILIDPGGSSWQVYMAGHRSGGQGENYIGRYLDNRLTAGNFNYTAASDFTIPGSDGWEVLVIRRSSATGNVTFSKKPIGSGSWTHFTSTGGSNSGADLGAGGRIRIGNWEGSDDFNGKLAVAAIWDGVALSDTDVETLDNGATQDWYDRSPDFLIDDSDGFATNLMTETARTSISGTTDDADDPSGWVYFGEGGATAPSRSYRRRDPAYLLAR